MDIYIKIEVPEDWAQRLDMQQTIEREIKADRWAWLSADKLHTEIINKMSSRADAPLNGAERDTLVALIETGPVWDGDLPSKTGRDSLIDKGLAIRVVVKGEDGWQAATYAGRERYKALYPGPDGPADTLRQASANRLSQLSAVLKGNSQ